MKFMTPKLPERILKQLAKRPMMVLSAATLSLKVGKDAVNLKSGKIDAPEFRRRTGGHVGSVGLGTAGSYAGLALGVFLSPVPIIGGLLGGFAGGAVGEIVGAKLGRGAVEQAEKVARRRAAPPEPAATEAGEPEQAADTPDPGMEPPPRRSL